MAPQATPCRCSNVTSGSTRRSNRVPNTSNSVAPAITNSSLISPARTANAAGASSTNGPAAFA
eukprot:11218825-Lingulodinium_polyedra.AAC.1